MRARSGGRTSGVGSTSVGMPRGRVVRGSRCIDMRSVLGTGQGAASARQARGRRPARSMARPGPPGAVSRRNLRALMPPAKGFVPPDVFDEYRLVEKLGQGAMGQVYLGHDTLLDRAVAIKFISALDPDPLARERFLIEARAIARLS